jgi:hypothetical protein
MRAQIRVEHNGQIYERELENTDSYFPEIKRSIENGKDPTKTIEWLIRIGDRHLRDEENVIGTRHYIGD